jgi:hypothetical protein
MGEAKFGLLIKVIEKQLSRDYDALCLNFIILH